MIINYHESEKLKEDYNISFMIDDFKDKNIHWYGGIKNGRYFKIYW